ncbi:MAG: sulfatase [Bacteroidota bacterium]
MNIKHALPLITGSLLVSACNTPAPQRSDDSRPNIIFIFCDDLGYGDLGCFGASDIRTPNIDSLCEDGMRFSSFYSVSPVCSPSRAGLLTGRMPQRMGIHGVFFPESFTGLPTDEITMADMLKDAGYATGIVGKWHLGHLNEYLPLQRGFDEYFGIPYSNDMASAVYMEGNEVVDFHPDQHLLTRTYTEKAVDFIHRHREAPFFLYLAHSMPHVPIYASDRFLGTSERGLYGDVVQELDWSVGEIIKALKKEGLRGKTLIVFSSDNGPWLVMKEYGGSAGILREGKQFTFEGGQRVPTIASWPGHIRKGSEYNDMALMTDWFPTFCSLAGIEVPQGRDYDGEDLTQVLLGTGHRQGDSFVYFDGGKAEGYRKGDWKIKLPYEGFPGAAWKQEVAPHPLLLINLKDDPGECRNLAEAEPQKAGEMLRYMEHAIDVLGTLPPPLVQRTAADENHYRLLEEKYGKDYYKK